MNLEDYRVLFMVVTLGLALVVAFPALAIIVPLQSDSEEFSEFWLLGSNHMAENYPSVVGVGEVYRVFVGVGNHMGSSEYYRVYVKFGNSTQSLPDIDRSEPSSLIPLFEYMFFLGDGEVWESPVSFGFKDVVVEGDVLVVGDVVVDGVSFPVDAFTSWNSENNEFVFQLFFELWRYDVVSESFRFDDRFVGLRLNMTAS